MWLPVDGIFLPSLLFLLVFLLEGLVPGGDFGMIVERIDARRPETKDGDKAK